MILSLNLQFRFLFQLLFSKLLCFLAGLFVLGCFSLSLDASNLFRISSCMSSSLEPLLLGSLLKSLLLSFLLRSSLFQSLILSLSLHECLI